MTLTKTFAFRLADDARAGTSVKRGHRTAGSLRWLDGIYSQSVPLPEGQLGRFHKNSWWSKVTDHTVAFPGRSHQLAERLRAQAVYEAHRRKIRSLSSLSEGWNIYSAKPPSEAAINTALQLVDLLEKRRLHVEWVAPTVDDSIMVVLDTGEVRQEWEFYSDGDVAVMIQETGGEKQYLDLNASEFAAYLPR